jgi:hypothetical protein
MEGMTIPDDYNGFLTLKNLQGICRGAAKK